jgi:hypothetical protein
MQSDVTTAFEKIAGRGESLGRHEETPSRLARIERDFHLDRDLLAEPHVVRDAMTRELWHRRLTF